tara:strand:+ start:247 stop:435 length:189 start_codon:yes stop_codon:yes gene_type:complete
MTNNLQEFLIMGALVFGVTTVILGFRLTIIYLENQALEQMKRRQPELDLLSARIEQSKNKTA